MFLRRLSSSSSVSIPAPPLWWPVWGCRPPPGTPGRRDRGGSLFCTSSGLMESSHRSREPPHKRRRSAEEKEAQQGGGASAQIPGPTTMQGGPQGGRGPGAWTGGRGPQQGHATQPSNQGQVGGANWPPINQHSNQGQVGGANWPPINQHSNQGHVGGANWPPINQGQVGGANGSSTNNGMVGGANRPPPPPRPSLSIKRLQRHWESCSTDPPPLGGSADPPPPPLPPAPPPPLPPLPPGDCPDSPPHQVGGSPSLPPAGGSSSLPPAGCSPSLPPAGGSRLLDFSVMSYNLLSQELLQDNVYLYRHCSPAVLPWSYRLPNLLAEILLHRADIVCLQEVQQDHYEDQIRPALQDLGYQCEYKKRSGSKPDGCAVVFNSALFSLVSSNPVEFFRAGDALLDRDNVGQVVLLRPRAAAPPGSAPPVICVANTHLLYNPRRGDVKLAQLAILLAELGRLARLPDGSTNPVLMCGDLNSTPLSPLYRFLTRGRLDYQGLQIGMVSGQEESSRGQRLLSCPIWSHSLGINQRCQYQEATAVDGAISELSVDDEASSSRATLEHTLNLRSTYLHRLNPDGRSEVTTCHSRTAMTVDYIFYSPDVPSLPGGRGLQLLGRLSLVGRPELREVNGLPNQHHSSDHLPLLARFRLRL